MKYLYPIVGFICAACMFLAVVLILLMIWVDISNAVAWKSLSTLGVLFVSSLGGGSFADFYVNKFSKQK